MPMWSCPVKGHTNGMDISGGGPLLFGELRCSMRTREVGKWFQFRLVASRDLADFNPGIYGALRGGVVPQI